MESKRQNFYLDAEDYNTYIDLYLYMNILNTKDSIELFHNLPSLFVMFINCQVRGPVSCPCLYFT